MEKIRYLPFRRGPPNGEPESVLQLLSFAEATCRNDYHRLRLFPDKRNITGPGRRW